MNLLDVVDKDNFSKNVEKFPDFKTGDTIAVHGKIKEGNRSRIQIFQGTVISIKGNKSMGSHFRVRKISNGIGVERVFPFHSPNIEKIELVQKGKTSRTKLYYLRERSGKSARIEIQYDKSEK